MSNPSEKPVLPPGDVRPDFAAVIRACTETLKATPGCADAYCDRACAKRGLADLDGAIADATEAIRLDPGHAWGHRTLGDVHLLRGDVEKAVAFCDEAIRLDPMLAEAYNTRAGARLRLGYLRAALRDCHQAIQLAPNRWGFYITRGNVRYHMGDPSAGTDYQTAFEIDAARYARAVVQLIAAQVREEPDVLFANCAQHLQRNPRDTTSYIRRGLALLLLGRDAEAQPDFDRAVALQPAVADRLTVAIAEAKRVRGVAAASGT